MFVDGENRLWVEMGIYRGTVFRVYDLEGNFLFNAMVDYPGNWLTLNCWTIEADENGILAMTDLNGYSQKVYLLELADSI